MMPTPSDRHYVDARIHARHGDRADARVWARLAAHEDFRGYLQAVQSTPLGAVSAGLPADADVHAVERHMRDAWHTYVGEVASWHGTAYAPAFDLVADLPELPGRAHAARGDLPPGWSPPDSEDGMPFVAPDFDTWRMAFLAALPRKSDRDAADRAIDLLDDAVELADPEPDRLGVAADRLFRRAEHPFARVLAHLAAVASDLMTLRGELCVRRVLDRIDVSGEAS